MLREALPKAWHKLINDPDDLLVDLLIETTEKLSGFRPEIDDVEKFLDGIVHPVPVNPGTPPLPHGQRKFNRRGRESLCQLLTVILNKQIEGFTLLGKTHHPHNWKDHIITVSEEMYRRHPAEFDRALTLHGPKMAYFGLQGNKLSQPSRIS